MTEAGILTLWVEPDTGCHANTGVTFPATA